MNKRKIKPGLIIEKTAELIRHCSTILPEDVYNSIADCANQSNSEEEKFLLDIILENSKIAKNDKIPLCQDTGISIFFVEIGKNVEIEDKHNNIEELINQAVRVVYSEQKLRPSIIDDPLRGKNTSDNTPAIVNIEYNESDKIKISFLAKGGGSENASAATVLTPSEGFRGIKDFVLDLVRQKGVNSCPPLIIGIGVGGTIDHAALASKKALLRKIGQRNPDPYYSEKETELKKEINRLGIGAMGLSGSCMVLDVFIQALPRHMASLPVAVSILCHSARRGETII